jgi:hypothetical protein
MRAALHDCVGDSVGHCVCLEILSKFDHPHDLPPLIAAQSAVCHLISGFATGLLPHTFDYESRVIRHVIASFFHMLHKLLYQMNTLLGFSHETICELAGREDHSQSRNYFLHHPIHLISLWQ